MIDSTADRDQIVAQLREELVGPSPQGEPLDCSLPIVFSDDKSSYPPRRQADSGEEILQRDPPTARYGVGVLYPFASPSEGSDTDVTPEAGRLDPEDEIPDARAEEDVVRSLEQVAERASKRTHEADDTDYDIATANSFEPSSMAVTFLAEHPEGSKLVINAAGGRYRRRDILVAGKTRGWHLRSPITLSAEVPADDLCVTRPTKVIAAITEAQNTEGLDLRVEILVRPRKQARTSLITVSLVNRTPAGGPKDELTIFQAHFRTSVVAPDDEPHILPYPATPGTKLDEEEQSLTLLYRKLQTFAVGHGCAADWQAAEGASRANSVSAECLPTAETPSITPDIQRPDGSSLEVSMAALAGIIPGDDGLASLSEVVDLYEDWINQQRAEIPHLEERYQPAGQRHLDDCTRCLERMRDGLAYLEDSQARRAFQLANHAILLQQIATRQNREPRRAEYDSKQNRVTFDHTYVQPNPLNPAPGVGRWRAFQIAFLLMTLCSTADGEAPNRRTVELIWFPTGGGKTEAYLGLTAFALFMRRLSNPSDDGVHVLMRYTLRLLTAQQFQRASGLIMAMETLRRGSMEELGHLPFSIGIWVGNSTTPNTRQDALASRRDLEKGGFRAENKLLLRQCPWCGAQMGPLEPKGKSLRDKNIVIGYERSKNTVVFKCPDPHCDFRTGLPVYVIDEDIYEKRPSLIIGTVDKFAMLSWYPQARTLFGLDKDGHRAKSPPGLIIQDELHLISGPLGSMVGLFETVIEDLCTDKRGPHPIPPKIVSSTATIRRYVDQICALYARDDVVLFPPPGLGAGESFFSRYARKEDGSLQRGRMYVGVHAPGLGSQLTGVVRSFASLQQAAYDLPAEARDPWWTLMVFYNSLRELGTSLSLFQSDIPDYMKVLRNRTGSDISDMRFPRNILELTSRLRNDEVPKAIESLEVRSLSDSPRPVDVCLASSIIEVGIDLDRLSLMAVVSQPKTTSQYIQVTGRVGRRWWERPGLIVTIYSASRPRDRSHFEKFRSYHERLYAQVEPTSVTPFSPPAIDRALHGAMVAHVRQSAAEKLDPYPYSSGFVEQFAEIVRHRVAAVDPSECADLEAALARRISEWKRWERRKWEAGPNDSDPGLMYRAGEYVDPAWKNISWPIQQSMRSVDAECEASITTLYLNHSEDSND